MRIRNDNANNTNDEMPQREAPATETANDNNNSISTNDNTTKQNKRKTTNTNNPPKKIPNTQSTKLTPEEKKLQKSRALQEELKGYGNELVNALKENNVKAFSEILSKAQRILPAKAKRDKQWWTYLYSLDLEARPLLPMPESPMFHILANQNWDFLHVVVDHISDLIYEKNNFVERKLFTHALSSSLTLEQIEMMRNLYVKLNKADLLDNHDDNILALLYPGNIHQNVTKLDHYFSHIKTPEYLYIEAKYAAVKILVAQILLDKELPEVKKILVNKMYPLSSRFIHECLADYINSINYFNEFSSDKYLTEILQPLGNLLKQLETIKVLKLETITGVSDTVNRDPFLTNIILSSTKSIPHLQATIQFFLADPQFHNWIKTVIYSSILFNILQKDENNFSQAMLPLVQKLEELYPNTKIHNVRLLFQYVSKNLSREKFEYLLAKMDHQFLLNDQWRTPVERGGTIANFADFFNMPPGGLTGAVTTWLIEKGNIFEFVAQLAIHDANKFGHFQQAFLEHSNPEIRRASQAAVDRITLLLQRNQANRMRLGIGPVANPPIPGNAPAVEAPRVPVTTNVQLGAERQNTHNSALHRTVSESAKKLATRYNGKKPETLPIDLLKSIFIKNVLINYRAGIDKELPTLTDQQKTALVSSWAQQFVVAICEANYFKRTNCANKHLVNNKAYIAISALQKMDFNYMDPVSGIKLFEALNFVWLAIHDASIYPEEKDRENLRLVYYDHLVQIATEYRVNGANQAACASGSFNQIISVLDKQHPDVDLDHFAGRYMALYLRDLSEELYFSAPLAKQLDIMTQISQEEELPGFFIKEIADTFKEKYKNNITNNDVAPDVLQGWLDSISITLAPRINFEYYYVKHVENIFNNLLNPVERNEVTNAIQDNKLPSTFITFCFQKFPSKDSYSADMITERLQKPFLLDFFPSIKTAYSNRNPNADSKHEIQNSNNQPVFMTDQNTISHSSSTATFFGERNENAIDTDNSIQSKNPSKHS